MKKLSEVLAASGLTAEEVKDKLTGTVEEYASQKLKVPVTFPFDANQYENLTEAKASEDWPSDNEILKIVNRGAVTSAKASAYQKATKDLKAAYEKSAEFKIANLVKAAMAMGFSQAEAEGLAMSKVS